MDEEPIDPQRQRAANIAYAVLSTPPKPWSISTVIVLSALAVASFALRFDSPRDLGVLVGVILFHEAGHLAGMRMFGFTDLRMLLIPFFGGAASGRKLGASAVERAVVSLMGPAPGLALALVLSFDAGVDTFSKNPLPLTAGIVLMLVLVNGSNLIPILPLDGGRMFQQLLFTRTPLLESIFRVLAIGALGWMAHLGATGLWAFAFLLLTQLPRQARIAFEGARLRRSDHFAAAVDALHAEQLADLHDAAVYANGDTSHLGERAKQRLLAQTIRDLHDRAAQEPPRWWQVIVGLLAWLVALAIGLVALAIMFHWRWPHR